ncbi:MAG: disulfide bond formation protein B [Patescibacteria group bacterium]
MLDITTANWLLAIGTVLLNIGALKILFALATDNWFSRLVRAKIDQYGLALAFVLTLVGSALTLYYSEVLLVDPCGLCWLQRAFLYPQVVLFAIALYTHDKGIALYAIALSAVGAVIALYHHYLQMGGVDLFPCPAVMETVDCADKTFLQFGYITFPFTSFSLFLVILVMMYSIRQSRVIH